MIPIHEVSLGNWVQISLDGQMLTGRVDRKSVERVGVSAEGEMGWYFPEDVYPILLTEDWLLHFNFEKSNDPALNGTGRMYVLGPFILRYPDKDNEAYVILSCHGTHDRELRHKLTVHEFQNHYHGMTKVFIE